MSVTKFTIIARNMATNCFDWLNIIPNLLSESEKSTNAIRQLLSVEAFAKTDLVKIEMNEELFRWMFEVNHIGHCRFEVTQMTQTQRTQSWRYLINASPAIAS